ncbi:MAG TPA: acyl-CoA desaturase [Mycobacteriales bacterium]|nr:acyl-CoA desaturase [Mycobacteriales bacterium]
MSSLTPAQIEEFGRELDAIRAEVLANRGESDATYIRKVIKTQRGLEAGGRAALLLAVFPPAWVAGTAMLSLAKILENMEIGHNVLHGQWDWMRDAQINSAVWEWDTVIASKGWKHTHNDTHHRWTNVVGKDRDVGYTLFRMSEDQRWEIGHLFGPLINVLLAPVFDWGIALYDLEFDELRRRKKTFAQVRRDAVAFGKKVARQSAKDFVLWPLLSGPSALPALAGNVAANIARNVWSHTIIFCGHFPEGVQMFTAEQVENETRGEWYLRQVQGSANIEGTKLFHVLTGNLSHQIEHHLFPDLPSNRYADIAPRVRVLCEKYGLHYETGRLGRQYASMWKRLIKLSVPSRASRITEARPVPLAA